MDKDLKVILGLGAAVGAVFAFTKVAKGASEFTALANTLYQATYDGPSMLLPAVFGTQAWLYVFTINYFDGYYWTPIVNPNYILTKGTVIQMQFLVDVVVSGFKDVRIV